MVRRAEGWPPEWERLSPNAYKPVKAVAQTLAAVSRKTRPVTNDVSLPFTIIPLGAIDNGNRKHHARQILQECDAEMAVTVTGAIRRGRIEDKPRRAPTRVPYRT